MAAVLTRKFKKRRRQRVRGEVIVIPFSFSSPIAVEEHAADKMSLAMRVISGDSSRFGK